MPRSVRPAFLEMVHARASGHCSWRKTQDQVQRRAYWTSWKTETKLYCDCCRTCNEFHRGRLPRPPGLKPMVAWAPMEVMKISYDATVKLAEFQVDHKSGTFARGRRRGLVLTGLGSIPGRTGWYVRLMTSITSSSQRHGHARWSSMLTNLSHILNFSCYKMRWLIRLCCVGCFCISSFFLHVWCLYGQRVRFCFKVFAYGCWWYNVILLFLFVKSFSFEDAWKAVDGRVGA